jgi:hypothetical protein
VAKASGKFWRWIAAILGVAVLAGLIWGYLRVKPYGELGTTYIAKQLCSCVFVTGRSEASCRAEFKPDIDRMSAVVDRTGAPAKGKVSVRLAIFSGEAVYEDGFGCRVAK